MPCPTFTRIGRRPLAIVSVALILLNLSFFKPGQIGLRYKQYFLYSLTYLS